MHRAQTVARDLINQGERKIDGRARPKLAHPINYTFGNLHLRLVSLRQEFGQDRKVLDWIVRTFRVGANIDNVVRRMPGKILLEGCPGAGQDPAASIETGDRSSENITRQRECCDVATGRTSMGV